MYNLITVVIRKRMKGKTKLLNNPEEDNLTINKKLLLNPTAKN